MKCWKRWRHAQPDSIGMTRPQLIQGMAQTDEIKRAARQPGGFLCIPLTGGNLVSPVGCDPPGKGQGSPAPVAGGDPGCTRIEQRERDRARSCSEVKSGTQGAAFTRAAHTADHFQAENGLRVGDRPEVQEIGPQEVGVTEVALTRQNASAREPVGKLSHLSRDGVQLVARQDGP